MTKRMLIMLGSIIVLILVLAGGFALHIKTLMAAAPKPFPQVVTATKVESLEWQPQVAAVGTVTPVRGVDVTTEIAGLVREINFKSGQTVQAGDLLVQLNDDSDVAQLHSLQASAELAATVLARDKAQFAAQAISQAQLDSDMADLKSKHALVDQQKALVEKKAIHAPFSGQLGITTVNPGQYINPGDKIVSLEKIDPIYVTFTVPQKQVSGLSIGQNINLINDAFAGETFAGKITAMDSKVDSSTRNVQLQATLPNPKHQLLPGMFGNVKVDVGDKKTYLTLPQTAVTYNPYGSTVFVVKQDDKKDAPKDDKGNTQLVAQQVFVTTGATRGDQVAILTGLKAGDQVVTSGQIKLKNGTAVTIDNTVVPANNPNPTPQEH
jgi:membrane fusion protein (multidrug efflux system)